jgi:hypothetical protein
MEETGNAYSMSGPPANAIGNISDGKGLGILPCCICIGKDQQIIDKRKVTSE